jgi:ABC-type polysaccharide/polyol phosphate transport system ATPase subunit
MRGDKIGVIGANGSGKNNFIAYFIGSIAADKGKIRLEQIWKLLIMIKCVSS